MSAVAYWQQNVAKFFNRYGNTHENPNSQSTNQDGVELNIVSRNNQLSSINIEVPPEKSTYEKLYSNNVTQLTIENFENLSKAVESLDTPSSEKILKETKSVLSLKFENVDFDSELNTGELQKMSSKCCNKSVVVFFGSKSENNFLVYWKSKDIESFLTFKPYSSSTTRKNRPLHEFIMKFLIYSLSNDHLGLCNQIINKRESTEFELHLLADHREYNVLLAAAHIGDAVVVGMLLDLGMQTESPFKDINAQFLAYSAQHFDVLLLLLQSNLIYPPYMDLSICTVEIQNFMMMCFDIHHYIEIGDKEKVTEIVEANPSVRHFYNEFNESAAAFALKEKQFEIYETLMMREVHFGPHENTEEIMEGLDYDTQRVVRELHNKHAKDLPESHINLLMANSFVGHDVDNVHEKLSLVQHTFSVLNSYAFIRIILMVVAASKKFRIIFDFNRDNVHVADPTSSANTTGIFYVSGRIYIGARQLLNKMTENETFGTLAHELCHYALNLVYENDANPYTANDNESMQEFEEISADCTQKKGREEVVDLVYSHYPPDMHHAELAVRVPHLLGLYHGKPEKLKESNDNFKKLFEFVENKIGPEMKEVIPVIEGKVDKEIELKDRKISKLRRNFYVSIVLGIIVAIIAATVVGIIFHNPTYVYKQLSHRNQRKVLNSFVMYKNITLKFNDLYPGGSLAYERLTSDHISQLLDGTILNLDEPQMHYLGDLIDFRWENLATNLKKVVLTSTLDFQGQDVKYKVINDTIPKSINKLSSKQIIQVLNTEKLVIGKKIESSVDFYIDRKFIPEDTKFIDFEYKYGHNYVHDYITHEEHKQNRTMNTTFEQFANKFIKQSFESQTKIFDTVLSNIYYKSILIDTIKDEYKFLHKSSNELIEQSKKDKIVILSSEAGAGKTVSFQQLAIQIKKMFPKRWVSFIDLKDYTRFYKRSGTADNVEILLEQILSLSSDKNEFEIKVFEESFETGNAVLLWNGFDEISPAYNQFVINLIESIHNSTRNIQYVCTRPLYSRQLRDTFKIRTWELIPFTKNERHEFLTKFFSFQNVPKDGIDEYIEKVSKVVQKFEVNDKISYNFSTPMMLKLVGEIYENRNSSESPGLYEIYETFVQKKIIIWLTKSKLEYKVLGKFISQFSVVDIYLKYAFLVELRVFQTTTFALKTKKLQIMQNEIPEDLPFEEISRMGILYINGEKTFEFAHRTFTEFFIAKYFIENVYLADNYIDDDEAELRLELFFLYAKNYGENQTPITDFMDSYFQNKNKNVREKFSLKFVRLLKTKFRSFLFRLLDTNYPKIYEFLFKFFSKDRSVLLSLLHIEESETFYTAIFNPNYIALFTNPNEIRSLAQNYLSDNEMEMFINGRNQRGNILFGMHFYKILNITKVNDVYDEEFKALNTTSYWNFFEKVMTNLTSDEQKELLVAALSPKIYIYYDKLLKGSYDTKDYKNPEYEQLWEIVETNLKIDEIENVIENSINGYFELFAYREPSNAYFLRFLADKIERHLTDFQIFNFYLRTNILQKAHWNPSDFVNLWAILSDHIGDEEKKQVLLIDYVDDRNSYFYFSLNELKNRFSDKLYVYLYYDFTPFKILQRSLTAPYALTFDFIKKIYSEHFSKPEIQQIIMSSNDLIYYVIEQALEENCEKFVLYLKYIFEDNPEALKLYLEREILPTDLSVFPYVESFRELAASEPRWFNNLKALESLYDEVNKLAN